MARMSLSDQSPRVPVDGLEGVVCDLDGVVYHGATAVAGAVSALERLGGVVQVRYATNNASRTPTVVAAQLRELGITLDDADVLTSSTVGAQVLAESLPQGAAVLAVGGEGVRVALTESGLEPVTWADPAQPAPVAVLQGYGAEVTAAQLAEAAYAIQAGARWVATNTDRTLPTARGIAPGNGALVAAVRAAVDVDPEVVGKPGPLMYEQAARLLGRAPERMLGVGDRLETDIAGARAAGMRTALVLTGVHGPGDAAAAPAEQRPELLLEGLADLLVPYASPQRVGNGEWRCAGATARWDGAQIEVEGGGIGAARAAVALAWDLVDDGRLDADVAGAQVRSSVGHRPGAASTS